MTSLLARQKISSSSEAFCYLPCGRAFNCLRPQKDKKASRAHELVRISQESTAAYHFPQQNTLGEDKEKRRGLTTIADDEQFKQVVVVFGHFELGFLALRSLVLALADELVTKTQRKTANCSVSSREPLSSVARWITRCCSSDSLFRAASLITIIYLLKSSFHYYLHK